MQRAVCTPVVLVACSGEVIGSGCGRSLGRAAATDEAVERLSRVVRLTGFSLVQRATRKRQRLPCRGQTSIAWTDLILRKFSIHGQFAIVLERSGLVVQRNDVPARYLLYSNSAQSSLWYKGNLRMYTPSAQVAIDGPYNLLGRVCRVCETD
jgi:hypothetical protein